MPITSRFASLNKQAHAKSANHRRRKGRFDRLALEHLEGRRVLSATLDPISTYSTGVFDGSAAEIVAHDPASNRLFVTNTDVDVDDTVPGKGGVDVLDFSDPHNLTKLFTIDTSGFGAEPTSVAVSGNTLAVAVRNDVGESEGTVAFFAADGAAGDDPLSRVTAGFGPDMLTFTPDGANVLVANQGRPNDEYTVDPIGTVSIISIPEDVTTLSQSDVTDVGFSDFNGTADQLRARGIRIYGPKLNEDGERIGDASVAQDLEPEYITVSADSSTAWVTLQENNAVAILDIDNGSVRSLEALGYKDHSLEGSGLDASDRDDAINIASWPIKSMYQPDGIASFTVGDETFLVTANEGGSRDSDFFNEESRVKDLTLGGPAFAQFGLKDLQEDDQLGRLQVTTEFPSVQRGNNGAFHELYAFGTRSFSIWSSGVDGDFGLVYDSGDDFEQITADQLGENFNANDGNDFDDGEPDNLDNRSDNKGPEPETVVVGEIDGRTYAFIGMERVGGIMVYDVTDPTAPVFQSYVNRRDFTEPNTTDEEETMTNEAVGDLAVEGLVFISADDSPNGIPMLVAANEVSGTTTVFEISVDAPEPEAAALPVLEADLAESNRLTASAGASVAVEDVGGRFALPNPHDADGHHLRRSAWQRSVDHFWAKTGESRSSSIEFEDLMGYGLDWRV